MTRHVSKQQQVENLLNEIKSTINRGNVDVALPILNWTKEKIDLADGEAQRVKRYLTSGKKNSKPRLVKRGDVYYAHLGKNVGSEQNGYRPVVVVQQKQANVTSPTVIIVPLTDALDNKGNKKRVLDTHVPVTHPNLSKASVAKTEYVRSISKNRLRDKVCKLDPSTMDKIDAKLKLSLNC